MELKKELEGKYRLHATKVDRIAVVDRPAVPDAKIVLFKRKKEDTGTDVLEKASLNFNREFVYRSTLASVEVLEQSAWTLFYSEEGTNPEEFTKAWGELFKEFRAVLIDVVLKTPQTEKINKADAQDEPTVDEIVNMWTRQMNLTMASTGFEQLRNFMGFLMLSLDQSPNSEEIITKVIDVFEPHVLNHFLSALGTYEKRGQVVVDKEGRVLSGARVRKLEQAMLVINELLDDAKPRLREKINEEDVMDKEAILKAIEESPILKGLVERLVNIETTLKEQKLLLTTEEKAELEKKEADAKAELEKKEAEEKAELEKKQAEEKAELEKAELEKAEKEKAEIEKAEKEKAEIEKGKEDRLVAMEKGIESVTKVAESIAKKMGISTSLKNDGDDNQTKGVNAFDKVMQKR